MSPEGRLLASFCTNHGFQQLVRQPTRGKYLLDLALSTLEYQTSTKVLPRISDHAPVLLEVHLPVPSDQPVSRECWAFSKADWKGLGNSLSNTDWLFLLDGRNVDSMVEAFTDYVLDSCRQFIPIVPVVSRNSSHPWLNSRCYKPVQDKHSAEGTPAFAKSRDDCSEGLKQEFDKFVRKTKGRIAASSSPSKMWWKLSHMLSLKDGQSTSIPPLQDSSGQWVRDAKGKADLFADTFGANFVLPGAVANEYSEVGSVAFHSMSGFFPSGGAMLQHPSASSRTTAQPVQTFSAQRCYLVFTRCCLCLSSPLLGRY